MALESRGPRVGHYVDRYPNHAVNYIYEQVRGDHRGDWLAAAARTSEPVPKRAHFPTYLPPQRSLLGGLGAHHLTWRISTRLIAGPTDALIDRFLDGVLLRHPADLLHAHFGMAGTRLTRIASRHGVPLATSFYGVDASAVLRDRRWQRRYDELFRCGDLFIVLSDEIAERFCARGCDPEKIVVWDIGVDFSAYPYREHPTDARPLKLLTAARFVEKKGHSILLDAVRRLRAAGLDTTATLMGYGPLLRQIEGLVNALGLSRHVTVIDTAQTTDFQAMYGEALTGHDVFVLPSIVAADGDDEAGPPLTLVAAQAAGMPVVTTQFVGSDRCVVADRTAIVCAPAGPSVADGITRLAENPAFAARIAAEASRHVQNTMSLQAQLESLEGHYARVLKTGPSAHERGRGAAQ